MNRSQSKGKKTSVSKQHSAKELKKGNSGAISARRIVYQNNEWVGTQTTNSNSKPPSRSTSASNLKKRSFSTNAVQGLTAQTISAASLSRRNPKTEKRPVETISKYGSSDMNAMNVGGVGLGER